MTETGGQTSQVNQDMYALAFIKKNLQQLINQMTFLMNK